MSLVLSILGVTGGTAHAAAAGSISGVVTSASGESFGNLRVMAYQPGQVAGTWYYSGDTYAEGDGTYEIAGLTWGPYRLGFVDEGGGHVIEYYDNAATVETATSIAVVDGQASSGRDAELVEFGRITGTVKRTDGRALDNILVEAVVPRQGGGWTPVRGDITGADGTYEILGIPDGTYRVTFLDHGHQFLESYVAESYDDAATTDGAQDLVVAAGSIHDGVDAVMEREGVLGGTVTNTHGDPLGNIQVEAFTDVEPGPEVVWAAVHDFTVTDSSGGYAMTLPTGDYRLHFGHRPGTEAAYLPEWYDNADTLASAPDVRVTNETTTTIPAVDLAMGGRISGGITDQSGAPVWGMWAAAFKRGQDDAGQTTWTQVANELQTESGAYTLGGLTSGTYRVRFTNSAYSQGYLPEFYDDAATLAAAADIVVVPEGQVAGIDAVLMATGTIAGNVSSATFFRHSVRVEAYSSPDGGATWQLAQTHDGDSFTDSYSNGDYSLSGLPPGTYRIKFDEDAPGELQTEFYDDVTTIGAARDIVLVAGETRTLGNAVLTDEPQSSPIVNAAPPTLSGAPLVGAVLSVQSGAWTTAGVSFTYQWLRNGAEIDGATGSTRTLALSDRGAVISARVTATKAGHTAGSATTTATPRVRSRSSIAVSAQPGRRKVSFRLSVASAQIVPTGSIVVMRGTRKVATVRLSRGAASVTLRSQPKGARTYTFRYSGDISVAASNASKRVRIR
ncbi:MAG: carboxypeptidase-like regulatory domain-containing protein [Nocardioides sp.]|nr:carboxypeptidase-like regulatory domain-containing protein [Nocardioides sp.]